MDLLIESATAGSKEIVLPWAPSNSLDSGLVVGLGETGSRKSTSVPDVDEIVVASRGKLPIFRVPLETTNLLLMT